MEDALEKEAEDYLVWRRLVWRAEDAGLPAGAGGGGVVPGRNKQEL